MFADKGADAATRKLYMKLVLGLQAGTCLEFFDFSVYSQLGKYVGPNFFPAGNVYAEQLSFWATYAVAFIVRPIGALLFGHWGDRHSRKTSLIYSLMLMAVPTTLMGCLPTFSMISWAAPVLLVLLRLAQGLAIGGENGSAIVYLYEVAPVHKRGFVVTFGWTGVALGVFLGIAVVLILTQTLSHAAMMLYGWRIAFLLGALTGLVGVLLRRRMPDPAVFLRRKYAIEEQLGVAPSGDEEVEEEELEGGLRVVSMRRHSSTQQGCQAAGSLSKTAASSATADNDASAQQGASKLPAAASSQQQEHAGATRSSVEASEASQQPRVHITGKRYLPALEMLRFYWRQVLLQWCWEWWFAAAFYAYVSFVPGFLAANVPGMTQLLALCSTMVQIILLALVAILTGIACDRGMPRMTVSAAILVVVGATLAPAALWMRSGGVVAAILVPSFYMLLIGVVGGAFCVAMCPLYPPEVRTSGLNFAHQLAVGPVGGISVVVLAAIKSINGDKFMGMVVWLAVCAAVSLVAAVILYYEYPQSNRDPPPPAEHTQLE